MLIFRAYKTELNLNNKQKSQCLKYCGVARFVYNWGLNKKIQTYNETGKTLSNYDLHNKLVVLKKDELSWLYGISKYVPQEALRDLDNAYSNFFRRVKQGIAKPGFPKFKSRKNGIGSFRLRERIKVFNKSIQLPRLGILKLKESGYIPIKNVKILSATISEKAGKWFVSVQVQEEINIPDQSNNEIIGIDLGVKSIATCSNGIVFDNPKALRAKTKQLKKWQRRLSKCKKGSQNSKKIQKKLAKIHYTISNIRKDSLHKATSKIISLNPKTIVLEDLNVKDMMKNHNLAKSISDVGIGEFARQISYKSLWYGINVVYVDRWFPSSKKCSNCGHIKQTLKLSERIYNCELCGFILDRDLNAAINLKNTVSSTGI